RVRATDGTNFSSYSNVATATPVQGPGLSTLSLTQGPIGASVTITGSNFGLTQAQGSSTITFGGTPVTTVTSWSDTSIDTSVPAGAGRGNVVVSVGGINSIGVPFTVTPGPNVASLSPNSGLIGTSVTISGAGFGATQGSSTITFNGVAAAPTPANWSDTSIVTPVPTGATTGNVVVTV